MRRFTSHRVAVLAGGLFVLGAVGIAYAASGPAPSASSTGTQHAAARPSHPSPSDESSSDSSDSSDSSESSPSSTPVGPDATGPAAFGLCTAYSHASKHGKSATHSIAFRNLAAAAGGADNIAAYCATITHPGSASPSTHPSGKPSDLPSHPTGKPSDLPTHGASD